MLPRNCKRVGGLRADGGAGKVLDLHEEAAEAKGQEAGREGPGAGAAFAALSCVGALLSAAHGMEAALAEPRLVHHVCRGLLGTRDAVILALQMLIQLCLFSAPAYRLAVQVSPFLLLQKIRKGFRSSLRII